MVQPSICAKSIIHEIEYDPDTRLGCFFVKEDYSKCNPVISWQFTSNKFSTIDYERLYSLGWNRCGKQFYKVNLGKSQIQVYSTRISINDFKPDKQQKKSNKKFLKYIFGLCKQDEIKVALGYEKSIQITPDCFTLQDSLNKILDTSANNLLQTYLIPEQMTKRFSPKKLDFSHSNLKQKINCGLPCSIKNYLKNNFQKNFDISKIEKDLVQSIATQIESKKLSDLVTVSSGGKGFLIFEISETNYNQITESDYLIEKAIHEYSTNKNIQNLVRSHYQIIIKPAVYNEEAFNLFVKYQSDIHNCKATIDAKRQAFINNLCLSPLFDVKNHYEADNFFYDLDELDKIRSNCVLNEFPIYQGTYHLHHRLEGKLIAVSVVDILPETFYSSYFFYDPNFLEMELGKVSVQFEVEYAKSLRKEEPLIKYYTLGLYSQECKKNKYKIEFHPSQILCPYTYQWVLMSQEIQEIINQKSILSTLSKIPNTPDALLFNIDSLREETENLNVMILNLNGELKKYKEIAKSESSLEKLKSLVNHV